MSRLLVGRVRLFYCVSSNTHSNLAIANSFGKVRLVLRYQAEKNQCPIVLKKVMPALNVLVYTWSSTTTAKQYHANARIEAITKNSGVTIKKNSRLFRRTNTTNSRIILLSASRIYSKRYILLRNYVDEVTRAVHVFNYSVISLDILFIII